MPPDSYLNAHLNRTRRFLEERGLRQPQPPKGNLPHDLQHFLETLT